jgi:hypothetical protein
VGEAARDQAAADRAAERVGGGGGDGAVERGEAIPGAGGLEGVGEDAERHQRALQVRRVDEGLAPARAGLGGAARLVGVGGLGSASA